MKKMILLVMMVAFGITVIGNLDAQNNRLIGTWIEDDGFQRTFDNVFFELFSPDGMFGLKGTYVIKGDLLITTTTHLHGNSFGLEPRWYSQAELAGIFRGNKLLLNWLETFIRSATFIYVVRGDTLTLTAGNNPPTIFYRK